MGMSRTGLSESLQLHWQRSPLAQRCRHVIVWHSWR